MLYLHYLHFLNELPNKTRSFSLCNFFHSSITEKDSAFEKIEITTYKTDCLSIVTVCITYIGILWKIGSGGVWKGG